MRKAVFHGLELFGRVPIQLLSGRRRLPFPLAVVGGVARPDQIALPLFADLRGLPHADPGHTIEPCATMDAQRTKSNSAVIPLEWPKYP